jgi:hypothetical protein
MGQLEALQSGKQGSDISFKGATPAKRAGADTINDLHVDDISKPSGHVHRGSELTDLGTRAETLQGSKFNNSTKYEKPTDISGQF